VHTSVRLAAVIVAILAGWVGMRAQSRASDESMVRSLDEQARLAALRRDIPALERLWSEHMVVNAPNNQVVIGRRAVIEDFVRAGVINFSRFERQIEFMRIDGDFATTMGLETVVPISDAPSSGLRSGQLIQRRVTNIWRREGDTWRLFIRHANVIPTK
jgi:ketosteroid isomerase-like protein